MCVLAFYPCPKESLIVLIFSFILSFSPPFRAGESEKIIIPALKGKNKNAS